MYRGLLLIAAFFLLAACEADRNRPPGRSGAANPPVADAKPQGSRPLHGGTIVVGVQQEPERLSEILNGMVTNNLICNLIFSKFVKYDDGLRLVPDLLETIPTRENGGISADHLSYTYKIRKDAQWHDGVPVTSFDASFTFDVIMDPKINVESREGWNVVASVETPDSHTVVFHLKEPYPDFVAETFYDESVLPQHLLFNEMGERFNISAFHHAPIGSGAFKFEEWASGSHLILSKNEKYYGEGPYLERVIFKFIPDENALLIQLKTGEIDIYDNAELSFLEQLERIPGVVVYRTPMMMYEHLDLNTENPILSDRRVRRALSYATNKEALGEKVYGGIVRVAHLDDYPHSRFYDSGAASKATFDPLEARRLLRDAGWTDKDGDGVLEKGDTKLSLTITTTAGRLNRERTQAVLRDQYREVGVDLRIRNYNATLLYGSFDDGGILKRGKFDMALYAWLSSPEPATKEALYSEHNIPPRGQNHPRIRNAELTRLLHRGAREIDETERVKIYAEIAHLLVDEAPVIPLFWYTSIDVCTARLRNFKPNPTQSADTWNASAWYLTQ